jgi:uncharacterized protein (DUF58 family)
MIPRELLKEVRRIEAMTTRRVNESMAGQYHSVFKGRGMDFDEVRQYREGDDVRTIDWNVSARMNDTFVKVYVEERELTVMLLVDMSASGRQGTRGMTKRDLAARVAALFGFSAIRNNDRVGVVLFSDHVEKFIPPKKGRNHVLRAVTEILAFEPKGRGTDLSEALAFLSRVAHRQTVAVVVSDFLAEGWERALRVAHGRHDLVPVIVSDPMEEELPDLGLVPMEDLETGEMTWIDTSSARVRAAFHRAAERAKLARETEFRKLRIEFTNVRTDKDYVDPIAALLRRRAKRVYR